MNYNGVIDHQIDTDLATEPVSLDDLKRHLNMVFDTDGAYQFDDDDTLLETLITTARQAMEEYTGLSFGGKTITAILSNYHGDMEIPYGPVRTVTTVKDSEGNTITTGDYQIGGLQFKTLCYPRCTNLTLTYTAGYTVVPEPLKRSVCVCAAWLYHNRTGTDADGNNYCKAAYELAAPYKRTSWLV